MPDVLPGFNIMIGQSILNLMRQNLVEYGAAYVNFDYQYNTKGGYDIGLFPFRTNFKYFNLVHDPISFDLNSFDFNFTKSVSGPMSDRVATPVITFKFPLVRRFAAEFDYNYKSFG